MLDSGRTVFAAGLDLRPLRELHLMTAEPFPYVFNVDPNELANSDFLDSLRELVAPAGARCSSVPRPRPSSPSWNRTRRWSCCSRWAWTNPAWTSWPGWAFATLGLQT
ncbi:MAG TPA: hypothetical protein VF542_12920 [Jatrophihabitans sp.]